MKRVIPFLKFRFVAFTVSILVIVGGIGSTFLFRDYNWGVDFKGGLSQQLQIAPTAFRITNISNRVIEFDLSETEISYLKTGESKFVFPRIKDQPLADMVKELESAGDLKVEILDQSGFATSLLLGVHKQIDLDKTLIVNHGLPAGSVPQATITKVRDVLLPVVPSVSIQAVGAALEQDFMVRSDPSVFKAAADTTADDVAAQAIISALEAKFGPGTVIQKQKDSLGPQQAQTLATGSIVAVIVALIIMLVYVSFRFRLNYAVAAVIALIHDALTTIAFVGIFQVEVNTAVVAAILTIIGFSINDTVVIYDRIRENEKLLKGRDLGFIMNSSLSQTLARTFITSFVVFVAIFPLYIFGTGPVKDFSFTMIFGIITGTYSSIFIASPIALAWQRALDKVKRNKEIRLYGKTQTPELEPRGVDPANASETGSITPEQGLATPPSEFETSGSGPITRVQRVLDKKKKKRHI
jgi:preprotein translocase subunit SecF